MSKEIPGLVRIKNQEMVVGVLLEALKDFPALRKSFPSRDKFLVALEASLRFYVPFSMKYGQAYSNTLSCNSIAIVIPSQKRGNSKIKYFLAGSYSKRYRSLEKLLSERENEIRLQIHAETEQMEKDIQLPKEYMYISFFGVKNGEQYIGEGKEIIEKIIEESNRSAVPIILYANEQKQVGFYQDLGFKIIGITSSKAFEFMNVYLIKE